MFQKIPTLVGTIILVIIAITAGAFVILYEKNNSIEIEMQAAAINPTKKTAIAVQSNGETADWQTYKNDKYGFEFKYPSQKISIDEISPETMPSDSFDGSIGINFLANDSNINADRNIDGGLRLFYNIPSVAFGANSLEESIKSGNWGYYAFIGFSVDYKWQCGEGQNKGGDKIRNCSLQEGKNVYEFDYNYAFSKVLTRDDYDSIVKSFKFTNNMSTDETSKKIIVNLLGKDGVGTIVSIKEATDNYISADVNNDNTINNNDYAGGYSILAAKVSGKWKKVWSGNGEFSCQEVAPYNFPPEMISGCYQ